MRQVYFNATACIAVTAQLTSSKCAIYFSLLFLCYIHTYIKCKKQDCYFIHSYIRIPPNIIRRVVACNEKIIKIKKAVFIREAH